MLDTRQAQRDIDRFLGQLNPTDAKKALNRALNHTAGKAKTAVNRHIRERYNMKYKEVNEKLSLKRAIKNIHESGVIIKSPSIPIKKFNPIKTKKGVSVIIMRKGKLIRGAFFAKMKNGHEGVFARGVYNGGEFVFRHKRLKKRGNDNPITELFTSPITSMAANPLVLSSVQRIVVNSLPKRVQHEVNRLMSQ